MIILKNQGLFNLMTIGLLLFGAAPILAQPVTTPNPSTRTHRNLTRVLFTPPPDDQRPEQTRGAGSRHEGQCSADATWSNLSESSSTQRRMIPLVPASNYGLTTAQRPIFWIYLPKTSARLISCTYTKITVSSREQGAGSGESYFKLTLGLLKLILSSWQIKYLCSDAISQQTSCVEY